MMRKDAKKLHDLYSAFGLQSAVELLCPEITEIDNRNRFGVIAKQFCFRFGIYCVCAPNKYYGSHVLLHMLLDSADQACMFRRPLALGAAGGSLASFALRVIQNSIDPGIPVIPESLECLCPNTGFNLSLLTDLDSKSLFTGICIGLALGPILELVILWRQWWILTLRRRLLSLGRTSHQLFRDI